MDGEPAVVKRAAVQDAPPPREPMWIIRRLRAELSDAIDGGEECRARDSQLTQWIGMCELALGDPVDPWMRHFLSASEAAPAVADAPLSAQINALPQPLRSYVHDLETRCDPAGELRELVMLRDRCRQSDAALASQEAALRERDAEIARLKDALRVLLDTSFFSADERNGAYAFARRVLNREGTTNAN